MSSRGGDSDEERPRRSLNSNQFALVTFVLRTSRNVDVFWLNYQGERVKYNTLNGGVGEEWPIFTFETHPWIFRDADTGDVLVANNKQETFYPVSWGGEEKQTIVHIDIPVYTLRERCLQRVRKLTTKEEMERLYNNMEIPLVLKTDFEYRENVPFNERISVP